MTLHQCGDSDLDPGQCPACMESRPVSSRARQSAYETMRQSDAEMDAFMRGEREGTE
jgi:hypothetical protein